MESGEQGKSSTNIHLDLSMSHTPWQCLESPNVLLVGWAAGQQSTDGAKNPAGGLMPERAQNRL